MDDKLKRLNQIYFDAISELAQIRRSEWSEHSQKQIDLLLKIIETCKNGIEIIQLRERIKEAENILQNTI